MSTRATYAFRDSFGEFAVYKHHDGYPTGARRWIEAAKSKAWPLPRFEADEFGAAFVAANKDGCGSVRLAGGADDFGDTEWHYTVWMAGDSLMLTVDKFDEFSDRRSRRTAWEGPLDEFTPDKAAEIENGVKA